MSWASVMISKLWLSQGSWLRSKFTETQGIHSTSECHETHAIPSKRLVNVNGPVKRGEKNNAYVLICMWWKL